jgi:AcrR family transcriptional regulator
MHDDLGELVERKSLKSTELSTESKGTKTRQAILEESVRLASAEGLGAITIGRLAGELGMTKSGLFAHFGSKRKLQLETIVTARQSFQEQVMDPAKEREGIARAWALCDLRLAHMQKRAFLGGGGCFFSSTFFAHEGRSNALRDEITTVLKDWTKSLKNAVREAQSRGEIEENAEPGKVAFELSAMVIGGYWTAHLLTNVGAWDKSRTLILERLREYATDQIPSSAFDDPHSWKKYLQKLAD